MCCCYENRSGACKATFLLASPSSKLNQLFSKSKKVSLSFAFAQSFTQEQHCSSDVQSYFQTQIQQLHLNVIRAVMPLATSSSGLFSFI